MVVNSISNEDFKHRRINTLVVNVGHVISYINAMGNKDKKSEFVEMTETNKEYIIGHLDHIKNDLLDRIKMEDVSKE